MIKSVELKNFQGFAGEHVVRLAPITLVLGANATGKSSLGRALKLMAQSPKGVLEFSGRNIDLVGFEKAVFGQFSDDSKADNLYLSATIPMSSLDFAGSNSSSDEDDEFSDYYWDDYRSKFSALFNKKQIEYLASNLETFVFFEVSGSNLAEGSVRPENQLLTGFVFTEPNTREKLNFGFGKKTEGFFGGPNPAEDLMLLGASTESAELNLKQSLETIFVKTMDASSNSLLESSWGMQESSEMNWLDLLLTQRLVPESKGWVVDTDWIPEGEPLERIRETFLGGLLEAAAASRRRAFSNMFEVSGVRDYSSLPRRLEENDQDNVRLLYKGSLDLEAVNESLGRLTGNRYSVQVAETQTSTSVRSVRTTETFIMDNLTLARVSFENVGAGLGQIFPILNALFSGPQKSLLLIEQPELHLHPKAQADLAQVIVDAVFGEHVEQVILETHSETILLRLQRLIREGHIRPADVAVLVTQEAPISEVAPDAARGNMIYNLELRDDGEFEEPMMLSFAGVRLDEFL